MAEIIFTDSATALAAELLRDMPEYHQPCTPVVALVWSNGARDNRRGSDGEAVWTVAEEGGWRAVVAPWVETEGVALADHTLEISGLTVFVDPRARSATGTLVVDATAEGLAVEHRVA